ncbi:hypothetical protein K504DRAFT_460864 [Pleomassaria siparia CBS 279.74]|uniref:F-box domain-containing protein n=1 Tax=Pleomassaria siparia CBS 279.74 TaxID=1314801 RepID=A0A6G1JWW1_9PLEO|nr:hypothetical protein K504DRAFT_460864 [Pleomassaria siparia CBS 279.74]
MAYLPDEIVDMILIQLSLDDEPLMKKNKTLAALSRVSRQYHRIVESYLYTQLAIREKRAAILLLRTLQSQPRLGKYCTRLEARRSPLTDFSTGNDDAPGPGNTMEIGPNMIPLYLPNLEYLDVSKVMHRLQHVNTGSTVLPWMHLMMPAGLMATRWPSNGDFKCLKRIDADIHGVHIANLMDVFRLPAIETLNFTRGTLALPVDAGGADMDFYFDQWDFANPSIKHLSLYGAKPALDLHTPVFLAYACHHLESLAIIGSKKYEYGAHLLRCMVMMFQHPIANRLKSVQLYDERTRSHDHVNGPSFNHHVRQMAFLSPTTEWKVDFDIIDCLWYPPKRFFKIPPFLETLHIRSTSTMKPPSIQNFCAALEDLSRMVELGSYKKLNKVVVEMQVHDRLVLAGWKRIRNTLADAGVEFQVGKKKDCKLTLKKVAVTVRVGLRGLIGGSM